MNSNAELLIRTRGKLRASQRRAPRSDVCGVRRLREPSVTTNKAAPQGDCGRAVRIPAEGRLKALVENALRNPDRAPPVVAPSTEKADVSSAMDLQSNQASLFTVLRRDVAR